MTRGMKAIASIAPEEHQAWRHVPCVLTTWFGHDSDETIMLILHHDRYIQPRCKGCSISLQIKTNMSLRNPDKIVKVYTNCSVIVIICPTTSVRSINKCKMFLLFFQTKCCGRTKFPLWSLERILGRGNDPPLHYCNKKEPCEEVL